MAQQVAGRTVCSQLLATAQQWGELPAYTDRDGGPWQTITWEQAREQALQLAAGFIALGLQPGERVARMLPNRVEHVLADVVALHAGGVPVTFYATSAPDQIAYMAADCDARIAVLDGAAELARWQPVLAELPGLAKIIVRDPAALPAGDLYLSWQDFAALGASRLAAAPEPVSRGHRTATRSFCRSPKRKPWPRPADACPASSSSRTTPPSTRRPTRRKARSCCVSCWRLPGRRPSSPRTSGSCPNMWPPLC